MLKPCEAVARAANLTQQAHDLISTLKSGWFLVDDVAQPNLDLASTSLSDSGFNQNF